MKSDGRIVVKKSDSGVILEGEEGFKAQLDQFQSRYIDIAAPDGA